MYQLCHCFVVQTESPCYWLDLKRRSEENSNFTWNDGSSFNGFMDIFRVDFNFSAGNDDCVCVFKRNGQFIAINLNCSSSAAYICRVKGTETTVTSERAAITTQAAFE